MGYRQMPDGSIQWVEGPTYTNSVPQSNGVDPRGNLSMMLGGSAFQPPMWQQGGAPNLGGLQRQPQLSPNTQSSTPVIDETASDWLQVAAGTASGAAAGAALGPWGALIGGAIGGLGAGLTALFTGNSAPRL